MPDNRYSPGHAARQRTERARAEARQPRPGDGCVCEGGPVIVATSRHGQLTVALEHAWDCPMPNVAMDPGVYAATGRRLPVVATAAA